MDGETSVVCATSCKMHAIAVAQRLRVPKYRTPGHTVGYDEFARMMPCRCSPSRCRSLTCHINHQDPNT
jgi:hypothetical protein